MVSYDEVLTTTILSLFNYNNCQLGLYKKKSVNKTFISYLVIRNFCATHVLNCLLIQIFAWLALFNKGSLHLQDHTAKVSHEVHNIVNLKKVLNK